MTKGPNGTNTRYAARNPTNSSFRYSLCSVELVRLCAI